MEEVMNVRVCNNANVFWFKDVPVSVTNDMLVAKVKELKPNLNYTEDWEFEEVQDIPYGAIPINWRNV